MNESDKFTLQWNDFANNVSESFATLREEEDLFDVTLVSEDLIQLSAHKVVLSSCSPVFKQLIKSSTHPHPVLFLRGVKTRGLEYILDFIYYGQVDIFQDHFNDFLYLAQDLKIKGVSNENVDNKKEEDVHNTITLVDPNISGKIEQTVSKPLQNDATDFALDVNTDYDFDADYDFESTINSMMEKVGIMWHCKVCGKEYIPKNKSILRRHVELNHTTGFTHTCTICQKICSTKNALGCHKRKYHKIESYT